MSDTDKKVENEDEGCVWLLGTEHDGEVKNRLMFDKQLEVPVCDKHFKEHQRIMMLVANDYDIEEVVDMDPEEVAKIAITLELSGVKLESGKY